MLIGPEINSLFYWSKRPNTSRILSALNGFGKVDNAVEASVSVNYDWKPIRPVFLDTIYSKFDSVDLDFSSSILFFENSINWLLSGNDIDAADNDPTRMHANLTRLLCISERLIDKLEAEVWTFGLDPDPATPPIDLNDYAAHWAAKGTLEGEDEFFSYGKLRLRRDFYARIYMAVGDRSRAGDLSALAAPLTINQLRCS